MHSTYLIIVDLEEGNPQFQMLEFLAFLHILQHFAQSSRDDPFLEALLVSISILHLQYAVRLR